MKRAASMAIALVAAAVRCSAAHAQPADGEQRAEALFDEGKKLMAAQHYAEACARFAESDHTAPSGSAVANLAECYEKQQKWASAWRAWAEARKRAALKADIARYVDDRIARVEPRVPHVVVTPAPADAEEAIVAIDGAAIARAEWSDFALDPGFHVVEESAPGKASFKKSVELVEGARVTVDVPPLVGAVAIAPVRAPQPASAPPSPASPEAATPSSGSAQRTAALVAAAAGVVAVGVGGYFGLRAKSRNDDALSMGCSGGTCPTRAGVDASSDAASAGRVSTVAFGVGAALLAGGAALWLTAPSRGAGGAQPATVGVAAAADARSGAIVLRGAW